MLESSIERKVCQIAEEDFGVVSIKMTIRGQTGWPDRMFFIPGGKPLFIEFKRLGEEPRPKQAWIHKQLRKLGYNVEVHDNVSDALDAVAKAMAATQLSKEGNKVPTRARSRRPASRSRVGKDVNLSGRSENPEVEEADK